MFDAFYIRNGLKQGDALSPLLFNFVLEYTVSFLEVYKQLTYCPSMFPFLPQYLTN
jgi:hypothetical protein